MCGILAVLGARDDSPTMRQRVLILSTRLRHRGPDWSGIHQHKNMFLAHERLAIVDPASGHQPLYNETKEIVVAVNGEIYNHMELREKLKEKHTFATNSDCEVISHLYEEYGEEMPGMLDGMFSFVLLDTRTNEYLVARDHMGITSLYIGWGKDGSVWVASEMKALHEDCENFIHFPPGHVFSSKTKTFTRFYNPKWMADSEADPPSFPDGKLDLKVLRDAFETSVKKRLMSDVPFGVLLSGGLDSSLVASVASRYIEKNRWGTLHSFCIGMEGSPDLKAGQEVADFLGTIHHELHFTLQEGIDAIPDVIYHTETYDVTTIRASTPMFLMARKIKAAGIKMVLSGEGSDEVFGGYLYFHKAPNKEEFHSETCRKLKMLHMYDCLRANKATSAWGLEARVPFLDKDFLDVAMNVDPKEKMINLEEKPDGKWPRIEKWMIRKAFDTPEKPYLPDWVLWRQKEQFSDGVGYSWIDGIKDFVGTQVTDSMLENAQHAFPHNPPQTKEAYFYRQLFEKFFPQHAALSTVPGGPSVACSTPAAVLWDASWAGKEDPSGRAAGAHEQGYHKSVAEIANEVAAAALAAEEEGTPAKKAKV